MNFKELASRYQIAISAVYRKINQIMKEKVHEDITTDQFSTLQYVLQNQPCTSTEIANAFGIGKSAVTNQVNRLYKKGLIHRIRDESDRRNIYLKVTDEGKELVNFTETEIVRAFTPLLSQFEDDEIKGFIQSLERLARLMDETDYQ
ncbi:MAG TPA: MarR family transcriptional regulator [Cerasibacillus sp.]|uniref:MarR family winged helix-turn-helix transcriptional regulator n=1 Tax=Cerasibacillus sp. TaxID=2498711 RepID=UPI002F4301A9